MCTVVILHRPGHDWPLIIAANRDEMADRPWLPPARHWDDRPDVIAGKDILAGGTWMGMNDHGVVAAVLNRRGTLGPAPGLRSRGELPLEALDHADAETATEALSHINSSAYRPFNMVIADAHGASVIASYGEEKGGLIDVTRAPEGISLITAYDLNDLTSPRIKHYKPLFEETAFPDPDKDLWHDWEDLMGSELHGANADERGAMNVRTDTGFGTICTSFIALPAPHRWRKGIKPKWLFSAGPAGSAQMKPISL